MHLLNLFSTQPTQTAVETNVHDKTCTSEKAVQRNHCLVLHTTFKRFCFMYFVSAEVDKITKDAE